MELIQRADLAMYRAKTAGKARWVVYDPEMRSAAVERLQLESDLVTAIETPQSIVADVVAAAAQRIAAVRHLLAG